MKPENGRLVAILVPWLREVLAYEAKEAQKARGVRDGKKKERLA